MNRRGFLKFFGKGAAAGAIAGAAKVANVEAAPETFEYRGFVAEWTGWKQSHDSDQTVGQWLAKNPEGTKDEYGNEFGVYASYPGGEGQYHDYWAFDTGVRQGQIHIDRTTPESVRNSCKEDAKRRLTLRIDQALSQPTHASYQAFGQGMGSTSAAGFSAPFLPGKW